MSCMTYLLLCYFPLSILHCNWKGVKKLWHYEMRPLSLMFSNRHWPGRRHVQANSYYYVSHSNVHKEQIASSKWNLAAISDVLHAASLGLCWCKQQQLLSDRPINNNHVWPPGLFKQWHCKICQIWLCSSAPIWFFILTMHWVPI